MPNLMSNFNFNVIDLKFREYLQLFFYFNQVKNLRFFQTQNFFLESSEFSPP